MGQLIVGKNTYGAYEIERRGSMNNVTIGSYCSIARNVVIDSGFNHNSKFISTFPFKTRLDYRCENNVICKGDVVIGSDVWICENVLIMSGVTIGDGAVIGANSIVTKDVLPYRIVAGSPATLIKTRFSYENIEKLLKLCWWNWTDEKIKENAHLLMSENIEELLKK